MSVTRFILCAAVFAVGCASTPAGDDLPAPGGASASETAPVIPAASVSESEAATPPVMFVALCDAAAADAAADAEQAFGRAHDGLHTLAREVQDTDERAVAGDLLEAKQQVEAAFAADPLPEDLSDRLDRLVDAAADALAASGDPRPTCPERSVP